MTKTKASRPSNGAAVRVLDELKLEQLARMPTHAVMAAHVATLARLSLKEHGAHLRPAVRRAYWAMIAEKVPALRARASLVVAGHVGRLRDLNGRKRALERLLWALTEATHEPAFGEVAADPTRLIALLERLEAKGAGGRRSMRPDNTTAKAMKAAHAFDDERTEEEIRDGLKADRRATGQKRKR